MRWIIPLALLVLVMATASADTLCSQQEDESWGNLMLHGFQVEAYKPVRVGDKVCYSFYLKNTGSSDVTLGKKGVYLHTNDGDLSSNSGATISPGKSIFVKDCFIASSSGEWTTYPGVCIITAKGEFCHNFETSCTFDVFIECPENWNCMTAEDASQGNYIRYSDELCGYTITGFTAMNKVRCTATEKLLNALQALGV